MSNIDTPTVTTATASLTGAYDIDPAHSRIGFAAKHAMVATVRGHFATFTAEVELDQENVGASRATLTIDAASISTGNEDRDAHLRNEDFFDVAKYPEIRFVSTGARQVADDEFELDGELTIKDTTKPVTVRFEKSGTSVDPWGGHRVGFEGSVKISRKDWGLTFNVPLDGGGMLVSDKITIELDIAAVRRAG